MPGTSVCQHLKQNFFTKGRTGMTSCFKGRFKVTSIRGYRTIGGAKEYHGGLDLVALDDKNVYAIADGTVDAAPYEPNGFGYYVRQLLPDGRRIYYGHMAKGSVAVKKGDRIKKGDKLGTMGSTGRSTGAHTHLEIRPKGTSKTSLDISEFRVFPTSQARTRRATSIPMTIPLKQCSTTELSQRKTWSTGSLCSRARRILSRSFLRRLLRGIMGKTDYFLTP